MEKKLSSIEKALKSGVAEQRTFQKAEKSKPGRKKVADEAKTNKNVAFLLNSEQFETLKEIADKECLSYHAFVKKEVLKIIREYSKEK